MYKEGTIPTSQGYCEDEDEKPIEVPMAVPANQEAFKKWFLHINQKISCDQQKLEPNMNF